MEVLGRKAVAFRGEPSELVARKLTLETCTRWKYHVYEDTDGEAWHAAHYLDSKRSPVAIHLRNADKDMPWVGKPKNVNLYGKWLWRDKGRMVTITEGEIDAMSLSQAFDHKWPVVSIYSGADGARKDLSKDLEWLSGFDKIVLCFDMDEPGRKAINACVGLFPPGKVYIAELPLKDANAMLVAGRTEELISAVYGAKQYRPSGLVRARDLKSAVLREPEVGLSWSIPEMNASTYGRRFGEVCFLGAGTGVGKTSFVGQFILHDLAEHRRSVAAFMFEQGNPETVKRVVGILAGKAFHVPDGSWTQEELENALDEMDKLPDLYLYSLEEERSWAKVRERIRFLRHAHDVRIFYIDNLTALVAAGTNETSEREFIEKLTPELTQLALELDIWIMVISHLSTPDGTPHEEGGRVKIRHFKGSRAIGFWPNFIIGLERDTQAEDEETRGITTLRILKDRFTGRSTGMTFKLGYNSATGRFASVDGDTEADAKDYGFKVSPTDLPF